MAKWKMLVVASVGFFAMPALFAPNSYAGFQPIELIPSQSPIIVNEGQPFDLTITVKNNGNVPFTVDTASFSDPVHQSGDIKDSIDFTNADQEFSTNFWDQLTYSQSSWYKYTIPTINDRESYTDGDGVWILTAEVSGTILDGSPNGTTYTSTLPIEVTVHDVPTPEPTTYALMGVGGLLMALRLRKSGIASMFTA